MAGFRGIYWDITGTGAVEFVRSVQINQTRRVIEDHTDNNATPTVICTVANLGTGEIECRDPEQAKKLYDVGTLDATFEIDEFPCNQTDKMAYTFTNGRVTGWGQGGIVGEAHATTLSITFDDVTLKPTTTP
jgi:hypothetical protein